MNEGYTEKRNSCAGPVLISLITGVAIGAVIGLLFAPKPGSETRQELREKGEKFVKLSRESLDELVDKTRDLTLTGRQKFEEFRNLGEEIFDSGREKVKGTVSKIKRFVSESKDAASKAEDYLS
jgi:gas vesicle protein